MPARSKPVSRRKPQRYHHGDLAAALLRAAEAVLKRDGLEALTLRAVAREAGVSHTAPQHHFGDLTGLLSELAAVGFTRFRDAMLGAAEAAGADERTRGRALGRAYIDFARENPGLFLLMFRSGRIDMRRPALLAAGDAAFAVLANARGVAAPQAMTLPQAANVTATWAFVHGLAFLSIDRRLDGVLHALPPGTTEDDLLAAVVEGMLTRVGRP